MSNPKVTVIVAAYNAEKYIERCLNSIAAQTLTDWEAIVVDDGSKDRTAEIASRYTKDSRFILIRQENAGVSSARNTGMAHATGCWVLFLDSDDEFPLDALAQFAQRFSDDVDMLIGGYEVYDESNTKSYYINERVTQELDKEAAVSLMYKPSYYRYLGYIAGKCYKKKIIDEFKLQYNQNIYFNEDRLFCTQYLCHCNKVLYFTHPVYHYYEHSASVMGAISREFNPKLITDMDGYIEMKRSIKESHCSSAVIHLANEGIVASFNLIKSYLNQHDENSLNNLFSLYKKTLQGLGIVNSIRFSVRVIIDKFNKRHYFS